MLITLSLVLAQCLAESTFSTNKYWLTGELKQLVKGATVFQEYRTAGTHVLWFSEGRTGDWLMQKGLREEKD